MKKKCQECGKQFKPIRSSAVFCKASCRVNRSQKQKRKREKQMAIEEQLQTICHKLQKEYLKDCEIDKRILSIQEDQESLNRDITFCKEQLNLDHQAFCDVHIRKNEIPTIKSDHLLIDIVNAGIALKLITEENKYQVRLREEFRQRIGRNKQALIQYKIDHVKLSAEKSQLQISIKQLEKNKDRLEHILWSLCPEQKTYNNASHSEKMEVIKESRSSGQKGMGAADLLKRSFDTFTLHGELGRFLGKLERQMLAIGLVGDPGAGKSTLSLGLAQLFDRAGMSVIYYSLELGIGEVFKNMIERYPLSNQVRIVDQGTLEDVRRSAQEFDCVIIDSFGKLGCKAEELDRLRNDFPKTIFLFILQKTTKGTSRGGAAINYDCSIVIDVIKREGQRVALMKKNRYGTIGWEYAPDSDEIIKSY